MNTRAMALLLALFLACFPAFSTAEDDVWNGHLLLDDMGEGPCKTLTGTIPLTVVFVSVEGSEWTQAEIDAHKQELLTAGHMLHSEAALYGAPLDISLHFHSVHVSASPDMHSSNAWVDDVLSQLPGLHSRTEPNGWLNQPLIFFCSNQGRAFAHSESNDHRAEYAVLYRGDDSGVIRHELLHLFGATDYYVEPDIAEAANAICPDSIMLSSGVANTVDELTAYIIGWTEQPGTTGTQLLTNTVHISAASLLQSRAANQVTGLGSTANPGYTYTGMLADGLPDGWGMAAWDTGDSYLGQWELGQRNGVGVYTWSDGTVYSGDFSADTRSGLGHIRWDDGSSYSGGFQDGQRHGQGVYIWSNGDLYAGDFFLDARTGQGTQVKANGSTYTGGFVNGQYDGQGTLIYPDGSVYTGGFSGGRFHGTGTYIWPDGSSYSGGFQQGKRHGHGLYRDASGGLIEGEWFEDELVSTSP